MKNILMLHYDLHFYRIPIYNKLAEELKKDNINLIIWPEKILNDIDKINFDYISDEFTFEKYKQILTEYKIETIINFIQPRSPSFSFYLKVIFYTYLKKINLLYYGHGLNLSSSSITLNFMYNFLHLFYKKIILYTPNEKKLLWPIHHKKIEIAYNTLDLSSRKSLITKTKNELREEYGLKDEFVVLFSGRIEKRKKLDILLNIMKEKNGIKLIVVGPTKDKMYIDEMSKNENIIYLGPVYDTKKMGEIFYISDVFSIPGHIGLGLVEALYWGLPIVTLDVKHAPEIYYLKNEYNGFVLKNPNKLKEKLYELSKNRIKLEKLSKNAEDTYKEKAEVSNMIKGFTDSIKEVTKC